MGNKRKGPGVDILGNHGFTGLLVTGATVAAAVSLVWLALVLVLAVVEAATEGRVRMLRFTGCPVAWRRRLMCVLVPLLASALAVGTTTTAATAAPSGPDRPWHGSTRTGPGAPRLDGLPLPDRQPDAARGPTGTAAARRVVVRPGDTLWQLAAGLLPPDADNGAVASLCQVLYSANRTVIGDDPDVIRPGQRLRVPRQAGRATVHLQEEDR